MPSIPVVFLHLVEYCCDREITTIGLVDLVDRCQLRESRIDELHHHIPKTLTTAVLALDSSPFGWREVFCRLVVIKAIQILMPQQQ